MSTDSNLQLSSGHRRFWAHSSFSKNTKLFKKQINFTYSYLIAFDNKVSASITERATSSMEMRLAMA